MAMTVRSNEHEWLSHLLERATDSRARDSKSFAPRLACDAEIRFPFRMTPAFKEWHVIVGALGAGEQTIILRKGGIAEEQGGFRVAANRFWLFPTLFHAQREKTKATAHHHFPTEAATNRASVMLRFFADVVAHGLVTDWAAVAALDAQHAWTEQTVRERFDWAKPAGVHVLLVRVHRLATPLMLDVTPEMAGCKSWLDVPLDFNAHASAPVLDDATFAARAAAIRPCLSF
jgi:hypothetical protein